MSGGVPPGSFAPHLVEASERAEVLEGPGGPWRPLEGPGGPLEGSGGRWTFLEAPALVPGGPWRPLVEAPGGGPWWRPLVEAPGGGPWWRPLVEAPGGGPPAAGLKNLFLIQETEIKLVLHFQFK